jgi:hypothetical protein
MLANLEFATHLSVSKPGYSEIVCTTADGEAVGAGNARIFRVIVPAVSLASRQAQ